MSENNQNKETVLFTTKTKDNQEITVTNSRLIIPVNKIQKTYALAHLNSVYMERKPRTKQDWWKIISFFLASIVFGFIDKGIATQILSIAMLCGVPIMFYLTRPKHYVYVSIVGETVPTYGSNDKSVIQKITDAINNALVHRG